MNDGAYRRERAGLPAKAGAGQVPGHMDGENRRGLPARVPRYEDDEVGRVLPVDPVGVDEPSLHLVEPEGGPYAPRVSEA